MTQPDDQQRAAAERRAAGQEATDSPRERSTTPRDSAAADLPDGDQK